MTTPFSHYPTDADFVALGRDLLHTYAEWRARKLAGRIQTKCISPDRWRLMRQARDILASDTIKGMQYWIGRDCVSLLDSWCREAQELADKARQMASESMSPATYELASATKRIERVIAVATKQRCTLEMTLREVRRLPW